MLSQTHKAELPLNIDSTMISCFRSCKKKFYEEFVLGLRPTAVSIDLHAGACFASALENIYKGIYVEKLPFEKAKLRAFGSFYEQWGDVVAPDDSPKGRERVWDAVEEYFKEWPYQTDPVQPFMLEGKPGYEFTFAIPLEPSAVSASSWGEPGKFPLHPSGQPFQYSGRFDMFGQWGVKLVIRDEKTTKSIGNKWAEQWNLRSQFMGYVWACQQSGFKVDTVCVRGIGILKTKFTMVDAFKSYQDHLVARWLEQTRRDLWAMRRCWDEGYWDYNYADACTSYGGCVFRDICESPEPDRWRPGFVVRRWNPLAKNPVEEKPNA